MGVYGLQLFHERTRRSKGDEVRSCGNCGVRSWEQWKHVLVLSDADARQYLTDVGSKAELEKKGKRKGKGKQVSFEK